MIDVSHIISNYSNVSTFYPQRGNRSFQLWQKPKKCNFVWMMCIGPGAGGQGGAAGTNAVSASGGGSGAVSTFLYEASILPGRLYVLPGIGSPGGTGSTTTTPTPSAQASSSYVVMYPQQFTNSNINGPLVVAKSGGITNNTFPGGAFNTLAESRLIIGGGLSPLQLDSNAVQALNSVFSSRDGIAGSANSDTTVLSSITCAGGRGSLSTTTAGSSIASLDFITFDTPQINGGIGTTGGKGDDGIWSWKPIYGTGGGGGGGTTSGTAGNGGDGAYGCGGGGGGMAAAGGTGGTGGRGGDGLVIIATF